ncbi:condensation domain-containing protein [Phytohabitans aurantiacus]|uniref:Condensation domain-containing protein n=1 Tax=Phytohabitans aurantiacus TaxID=3016789 RepID=A0ABQ5R135_9ACTN|nr:condensation domain-containing protein [Phytohabitans aurantiacus]GLH99285.1 hypothetical protein Pa4123_45600 [Phytohabitans aurantiacus]
MHLESAPLSWGQQWGWQQQEFPPERRSPGLILTQGLELPEAVDEATIRAAVRTVATRHTAVRTTFATGGDSQPRQTVWPVESEAYPLELFDDGDDAHRWLSAAMDVRSAWPLRVALLRGGGERTLLGIAAHHLATDRYGFDVLYEELRAALHGAARGATPDLPPPSRQPLDIVAFERSPAGAALNERAIAYWTSHNDELGDELSLLGAGFDAPSGAMHVARVFSSDAPKRVAELVAATRASEPAVAVAAVAGTLAGYLDRSSVLMFMMSANRHIPDVKRSVCTLAQAGLIRVDVPDPRRLDSLIPEANRGRLTALRHSYYDQEALTARQRATGGAGHQLPVTPPSVNVVRIDESASEPPAGWDPTVAGGAPFASVERVDRPCTGLNFHVLVADSFVSIELRAGTHLLPAAECEALVTGAMALLLGSA